MKFFLNVSRAEQRERLLARIDDPEKRWKFNPADLEDRARWDAFHRAYEKAIRRTSTAHAPWHVVPADHKWFTRLVVAAAVEEALLAMDLRHPRPDAAAMRALRRARRELGPRR
jgi:polyphosphate kinase 2 (PPK2 family)